MGGNDSGAQYNFTGIKYYFNSYTLRGRCVLATYASLAALAIYFKFKPKKQAAVTDK